MRRYYLLIIILLSFQMFIPGQMRDKASNPNSKNNAIHQNKSQNKAKAEDIKLSKDQTSSHEMFIPNKVGNGKAAPAVLENIYTSNLSRNYFKFENNDNSLWNGKHWMPEDFPLKVYVKIDSNSSYRKSFSAYINYAFNSWEKADNRISFKLSEDEKDAQIVIWFENNLMDKYDEEYLGLTNYETGRKKSIKKAVVEVGVHKYNNIKVNDGEIKTTIIHELGHALGLGHSDNAIDIMFPYIDSNVNSDMEYKELSSADKAAIKSTMNLGEKNEYTKK
ncbi:MAG: matrixin family metalloprotease [Bacteroidota bacterium]|nr:matrixin family metalloprotease [Bacteroidota bacterium]